MTLDSALAYTHYGSSGFAIDNHYGTLDTRARVGHMNRNIRIMAGPDAGWGYSVTVYGYRDSSNALWIGDAQLTGV